MDPARWGVEARYRDHRRRWQEAPAAAVDAVLEALGADDAGPPAAGAVVVEQGSTRAVSGDWEITLEEGGGTRWGQGRLPADLPLGYHRLTTQAGALSLVVCPSRCHLPRGLRGWGWAVQLYAMRSRASWGIGDLADLAELAAWSAREGATFVLVNPLHASLPTEQQPSPYFPSSRCFRNPIYLQVDDPDGRRAGRALNRRRTIDRDAAWALKAAALERAFAHGGERDDGFRRWRSEQGRSLEDYATFCAISEEHHSPWQEWPARLRHPRRRGVRDYARAHADRVALHAWLQWRIDGQLRRAGRDLALVQDVAIGCDPAGADAWAWQDCFATAVRVGAPPDEFNAKGQDWGLPPFDPWKLRAAGYEPFIRTVRAAFAHSGGVRIDHVMGLFRLYWIPPGFGPDEGAYVRYPHEDLLGIIALESQRAGAFVVGEDLGTVEPSMRKALAARNVLSYRLLWFEKKPPAEFPRKALAAVTTHDLPTIAGLWSGADLDEQRHLGLEPNADATEGIADRLAGWLDVARDAPTTEVSLGAHELLAEAPSALVAATLDDALGVAKRPNVPGTTHERPNWSLALPMPLERIESDAGVQATIDALRAGREG